LQKKTVAVIFGGYSPEYGVSLQSAFSILTNLDGEKYNIIPIGITKEGEWYRYYGDFRYERINGENLTVVSLIEMEQYINCVISQEMSESWPVEALKAQAVCARTYAKVHRNKHSKYHFDLCSTMDCQAYIGMRRTSPNTEAAAFGTAGVCLYYQGNLAETYYFSSSGGATEDVKNVWGGTNLPYLKGVIDPYETAFADRIQAGYGNRKYQWSVSYTKTELAELLRGKGYQCADIVDFYVSEVSATGNPITITFLDSTGKTYSFSRERYVRTMMGVASMNYTIEGATKYYVNDSGTILDRIRGVFVIGADGVATQTELDSMPYILTANGVEQLKPTGDTFTIKGAGWGHNVGMSQWGAYAMATMGKTYEDILTFYFTGTELY